MAEIQTKDRQLFTDTLEKIKVSQPTYLDVKSGSAKNFGRQSFLQQLIISRRIIEEVYATNINY
jgi:hypothetical protein